MYEDSHLDDTWAPAASLDESGGGNHVVGHVECGRGGADDRFVEPTPRGLITTCQSDTLF